MEEEELGRARSSAFLEVSREDLERLSRQELEMRLVLLAAEKTRTEAALQAKSGLQGVADSLFKR